MEGNMRPPTGKGSPVVKTLKEIRQGLLCFGFKIESIKEDHSRWTLTLKTCGNKLLIIANSREEVWDAALRTAVKATIKGWVYIEGF
jgi:hypothetical protein